ncbi:phospholipid/cholesterol/gamma-HCH transport system substrate-binding protein [Spirosomataceae bacterium TFI 002]|nr:phospholipid/cholesterol/gamma-HCH transport system substrate-binding protein [Spirosomataceae bacterium TFI 002]
MKSAYHNAKVALFVLIGIVIFFATILVIGSMRKVFISKIEATAIFKDVSGLTKGNNIWFSGVKVGVVEDLDFLPNKGVKVTFSIEERSQKFIYTDSKAKISSDGIIGSPIIVIEGGNLKQGVIQDGHNFIVDMEDTQQDVIKTLQENNKNILAITTDLKAIVASIADGKGSVGKLLQDETLYNTVNASVSNLQNASASIAGFSKDMNKFGKQLNNPNSLPNQLLNDTKLMPQVRRSVDKLEASVNNLNEGSQSLKNGAQDASYLVSDMRKTVNGITQDTLSPVGVLLNDRSSAAYLQSTLQNMETSTEKLDENLEALQHNFLFRRYFRKKEKGKL